MREKIGSLQEELYKFVADAEYTHTHTHTHTHSNNIKHKTPHGHYTSTIQAIVIELAGHEIAASRLAE